MVFVQLSWGYHKQSMDTELLKMMLGRRIAAYRQELKMTQRALAEAIEVDPARMNRIERGSEMPTAIQVIALARALNVSSDELLQVEGMEYA